MWRTWIVDHSYILWWGIQGAGLAIIIKQINYFQRKREKMFVKLWEWQGRYPKNKLRTVSDQFSCSHGVQTAACVTGPQPSGHSNHRPQRHRGDLILLRPIIICTASLQSDNCSTQHPSLLCCLWFGGKKEWDVTPLFVAITAADKSGGCSLGWAATN